MTPALTNTPEERIARLEDALHRIRQWCDVYPVDVFAEPDLEAIRKQIGDGTDSALHVTWARHILGGIGEIAAEVA